MKFIYLLCLSFIIFSYVKADEEEDYDEETESDLSPREYSSWSSRADLPPMLPSGPYQSLPSIKKSPIIPPRPPYGYPAYEVEVSTIPSLKDKVDQAKKKLEKDLKNKVGKAKKKVDQVKKKVDEAKKKLEKDMKDKMAAIKQKKLEKAVKPKTTTPEPFVVYERVKVPKTVKVKKVKKAKMAHECKLIHKALFG